MEIWSVGSIDVWVWRLPEVAGKKETSDLRHHQAFVVQYFDRSSFDTSKSVLLQRVSSADIEPHVQPPDGRFEILPFE